MASGSRFPVEFQGVNPKHKFRLHIDTNYMILSYYNQLCQRKKMISAYLHSNRRCRTPIVGSFPSEAVWPFMLVSSLAGGPNFLQISRIPSQAAALIAETSETLTPVKTTSQQLL